jgi:hypothetical protein
MIGVLVRDPGKLDEFISWNVRGFFQPNLLLFGEVKVQLD